MEELDLDLDRDLDRDLDFDRDLDLDLDFDLDLDLEDDLDLDPERDRDFDFEGDLDLERDLEVERALSREGDLLGDGDATDFAEAGETDRDLEPDFTDAISASTSVWAGELAALPGTDPDPGLPGLDSDSLELDPVQTESSEVRPFMIIFQFFPFTMRVKLDTCLYKPNMYAMLTL